MAWTRATSLPGLRVVYMQDSSLTQEEARVVVDVIDHYALDQCPAPELSILRTAVKKLGIVAEKGDVWKAQAKRLADGEECDYDHHDSCQAHSLHEKPCPHEVVQALQSP